MGGRDLSIDEARAVLNQVFDAQVDPVVVAALLIAWRDKGETSDELTGMVRAMLSHARPSSSSHRRWTSWGRAATASARSTSRR